MALGCVYRVAQAVKIPILAVGGVSSFEDVIEFIYAGASAVAVGTAQFAEPRLPVKILDALSRHCEEHNLSVPDIMGKVSF